MKIIELTQNTPEWLEFRKNKLGASDAPIIMGDSPWCSPSQLWERKIGITPDQTENFAMREGKELEPVARESFNKIMGKVYTPYVVQHETFEWMIASLDGLSLCEKCAVEIKCPGREAHLSALAGKVPAYYIPQLQHQLAVTGLDMIYYYSYDGKQNACIEVHRDEKMIDHMIKEELKFYNCLIKAIPPDLTDQDYKVRFDGKWENATAYWLRSQANLKDAEFHEKRAREQIIALSESRNSKGCGVKVQKIMRQGCVNYSAIPALEGIDLDQYRKPTSESWRITLDG